MRCRGYDLASFAANPHSADGHPADALAREVRIDDGVAHERAVALAECLWHTCRAKVLRGPLPLLFEELHALLQLCVSEDRARELSQRLAAEARATAPGWVCCHALLDMKMEKTFISTETQRGESRTIMSFILTGMVPIVSLSSLRPSLMGTIVIDAHSPMLFMF